MTELPEEFDFLADDSVDKDTKKILLAALLEGRRYERDAAQKVKETEESLALKKKKFWHNTPLMLALVGTITVLLMDWQLTCTPRSYRWSEQSRQAVTESPPIVAAAIFAEASLKKLTTPNDKAVWVNADVSHIIGKVPANNPGSAMLEVANRRISVKESVADAEAILKGPQP